MKLICGEHGWFDLYGLNVWFMKNCWFGLGFCLIGRVYNMSNWANWHEFPCLKLFWTNALRKEYQFDQLNRSKFPQNHKIQLLISDTTLSDSNGIEHQLHCRGLGAILAPDYWMSYFTNALALSSSRAPLSAIFILQV